MDPFRNKETVQDAHSKSPYTKQSHFGITVPRFDITGTFSEPSCRSHSLFNKAVFNVSLDRGPFRITMVFNPWTQCWFSNVHVSYSTIQCLQPVLDSRIPSLEKMHPSTQQNSGLKLSMNILRTLTRTGFHTTSGP
ncbi:hypothetical protein TNCT_404291 [Trichonephila clavata]|uniref:Uncharacterized protein n=1 Tax=Trichonephila clavata TaxID=2740835 RepID=A0A8X6LUV3_TRICU|nr:hypothetical protein TNCT_404291 [Trichonephila clavata]